MEKISIECADGWILHGTSFLPAADISLGSDSGMRPQHQAAPNPRGVVVIACATGVLARYYHRYAKFLATHGFVAIAFDYRGIGASAPKNLKNFTARWYDWGFQDINAVLCWARNTYEGLALHLVGHSFGGFGVGLAEESSNLSSILTVGAQHAYWPDYAPGQRLNFLARWHLRMPCATLRHGYFDGKRRGWLEDLPRGVALDWARSRKDFTASAPREIRELLRANQRAVRCPILAIAATDDPFASLPAMTRALAYTPGSAAQLVRISPQSFGETEIGHFALFHARFADSFWTDTLRWLIDGENPWAHEVLAESQHVAPES